MKKLYVLYDSECAFCRRCRIWLGRQPAFVPLVFIPLQSPELTTRFPGIEAFHPEERLVVVSDAGELWRGDGAWITVLWALREYRQAALNFSQPLLRPLVRRFVAVVSDNRQKLSRLLGAPVGALREELRAVPEPGCNQRLCNL